MTKEDRMGRKSWLSVNYIGQLSPGLTRVNIPHFSGLIQQQAMHRRYEANGQLLSASSSQLTHSVNLVLPVLVYPETSVDSPDTASSIAICGLGRM